MPGPHKNKSYLDDLVDWTPANVDSDLPALDLTQIAADIAALTF